MITDDIIVTNEYRTGVGGHWPFLSDAGRVVQKDLDLTEYTDRVNNPTIPRVIVLELGLVIYKIYNGYWFLRAVNKKCRPDWDITTPKFKAAWRQGRKDLFYPYGKTYAQTIGAQDYSRVKPTAFNSRMWHVYGAGHQEVIALITE
jgi:hypothetical protein